MGQAMHHLRRVMSLRSDPGRLSLETVLTGTALWLALLYLMHDGAMAAGSDGGATADARPGDGGGWHEGRGSASEATGDGAEPFPERVAGSEANREFSFEGIAAENPPAWSGRRFGWIQAEAAPERSAAATAWPAALGSQVEPGLVDHSFHADPATLSGAGTGGAGWTRQAPSAKPSTRMEGTGMQMKPRFLSPVEWTGADEGLHFGSVDPSDGSVAGVNAPTITIPLPEPPEPRSENPSLRVVLRSDETLVSRSVEGVAQTQYRNTLGAITDAVIDLREISTPEVHVSSDRELHMLALSVLNDAGMILESHNSGLNRSSLLLGPETNSIRLQVSDDIDLGLLAGGMARGQVLQSLTGMLDSRLHDAGGGGTVELISQAQFHLRAPGSPMERQLGIDLLTQAMRDSAMLLGDGDNRVTIASGFRSLDGEGPGLLLTIPALDAAEGDGNLHLRARALGLVSSLLDTGGGDDQVSIATWLDASLPFALQAIALLDSVVILGEGDDRLSLEGAVIGSRIALGGGSNGLVVAGPMNGSTVGLGPDSSNVIQLGDGDDDLSIGLEGGSGKEMMLDTGGGDDRILLPMADLSGSIDGGAGVDTLRIAPGEGPDQVFGTGGEQEDPDAVVNLDGPGTGMFGSMGFHGLENLSLGDTSGVVAVGVLGSLEGWLEAGRGQDGLDYSSWQEPVVVDLIRGEASGILDGINGFEAVRGGSGDDRMTAAADTLSLEGGDGDDRFDLDLSILAGTMGPVAPLLFVSGGDGRDRFVLAGMEAILRQTQGPDRALPILADLERSPGSDGGIGLTDTIAWRLGGLLPDRGGEQGVVDLTPAGLEGIGQPRLLPIAPLDQLVSGMGALSAGMDQLAIATGDLASHLMLLGSDKSVTAIAELPALRTLAVASDPGASGVPETAPAA
jgi:hypothetical protein